MKKKKKWRKINQKILTGFSEFWSFFFFFFLQILTTF